MRQLLDRTVHDHAAVDLPLWQGPAAMARSVFDLRTAADLSTSVHEATIFASLHGLYWLVADLAANRPLLLAIDDVQWIDKPSLRWLRYLSKRLEGLPVVIVATHQGGDSVGELEQLGGVTIKIDGLDQAAVAELGRRTLGATGAPEFWASCHATTGGNAFLVHALLRDCLAKGTQPTSVSATHLGQFGLVEVQQFIREILSSSDPLAAGVTATLAVLGERVSVDLLAEVANLPQPEVVRLVTILTQQDILQTDAAGLVFFSRAIVRAAILAEVAQRSRTELHLRAARILHEADAPVERVAAHLLAAPASSTADTVDIMCQAAEVAMRRAAPESAARYWARALDEPLSQRRRNNILLSLGRAELSIDLPAAITRLTAALAGDLQPAKRGYAAIDLARAYCVVDDYDRAIAALRQARDQIRDIEPELAFRLEVEELYLSLLTNGASSTATRPRLRSLQLSEADGTRTENACAGLLAQREAALGVSRADTLAHARRALRCGIFPSTDESFVFNGALISMIVAGAPNEALSLCDAAVAEATRHGSRFSIAVGHTLRCEAYFRLGDIRRAQIEAQASLELRDALQIEHSLSHAMITLARFVDTLVEQDSVEQAWRIVDGANLWGDLPDHLFFTWMLMARGRLRHATGCIHEALADYLECGRRLLSAGFENTAYFPWRSHAARAHRELNEHDRARALAGEDLALARRWGTREAVGIALSVNGLLATEGRLELLTEAVDLLAASPSRLEHARATLELGSVTRATGDLQRARRQLRTAADLAVTCGSTRLLTAAEAELRAAGARPRSRAYSGIDSLTPSERRVAMLAARGHTNRNIAEQLFVGTRAVEIHLTNAYRKLHISRRGELVSVFDPQSGTTT